MSLFVDIEPGQDTQTSVPTQFGMDSNIIYDYILDYYYDSIGAFLSFELNTDTVSTTALLTSSSA